MPNVTPSTFDVRTDATATFAAYLWASTTLEDDGVPEADLDEKNGALWYANVRKALRQINEAFKGSSSISALTATGTIAADTFNATGNNPLVYIGSGSGSPWLRRRKADAGDTQEQWFSNGVLRFAMIHNSSENVLWRHYATDGTTVNFETVYAATTGTWTFPAAVSVTTTATITGTTTVGSTAAATNGDIIIRSGSAAFANLYLRDQTNNRWAVRKDSSNDLAIVRYNSSGVFQDQATVSGSTGNWTFPAAVSVTGDFTRAAATYVTGVLSPSALASGTTNDYAPSGFSACSRLRLTPDAAGSTLSSLAGGAAGRRLTVYNLSLTANLTLLHDSGGTAANRFRCPGATDMVIPPQGSRVIVYDDVTNRWRVEGGLA